MKNLEVILCGDNEVEILVDLNRQLREDEEIDNVISLEELRERMTGFINSDYEAYIFKEESYVVGYALINKKRDPLYLRQFFICRDKRRKGLGKRAFEILVEKLKTNIIDIEVFAWNERGKSFWRSLGFVERCIQMRFKKE